MKLGENSWVLLLIMLKYFNVESQNFQSFGTVERESKPLHGNHNPIILMFQTAHMMQVAFGAQFPRMKLSGRLSVRPGNLKAIRPFLDHLYEIDVERKHLLNSE